MGLSVQDHADLAKTTLADFGSEFDLQYDSQRFEFVNLYTTNPKRIDGGTSIKRNVILDHTGRAHYRQMFDVDAPAVKPIHQQIDVPWALVTLDYSWDVFELEIQMSNNKAYVDLLRSRRDEAMWDFSELLEDKGWQSTNSATDALNPRGVPYYLNKLNSGVSAGGFLGQTIRFNNGTTGTVCAGIDAAVEDKWRNWADTYSAVDSALLTKFRKAFMFTRFKSPGLVKSGDRDSRTPMTKVYMGLETAVALQSLLDSRDDNTTPKDAMGGILARIDGSFTVNGFEAVGIPQLDDDPDDAIYCVDWGQLMPFVHAGYWMEETDPRPASNSHTTVTVHVDGAHNIMVKSRRKAGFVLHKQIA